MTGPGASPAPRRHRAAPPTTAPASAPAAAIGTEYATTYRCTIAAAATPPMSAVHSGQYRRALAKIDTAAAPS